MSNPKCCNHVWKSCIQANGHWLSDLIIYPQVIMSEASSVKPAYKRHVCLMHKRGTTCHRIHALRWKVILHQAYSILSIIIKLINTTENDCSYRLMPNIIWPFLALNSRVRYFKITWVTEHTVFPGMANWQNPGDSFPVPVRISSQISERLLCPWHFPTCLYTWRLLVTWYSGSLPRLQVLVKTVSNSSAWYNWTRSKVKISFQGEGTDCKSTRPTQSSQLN